MAVGRAHGHALGEAASLGDPRLRGRSLTGFPCGGAAWQLLGNLFRAQYESWDPTSGFRILCKFKIQNILK